MSEKKFNVDSIVQLKKMHPCGCDEFKIIRTGIDIKIKCINCNRIIMLPRIDFEKRLKKVIKYD